MRIMIAIDNDIIGIWFNGTQITGLNVHGGCASEYHFRFDVPQHLVQIGENTVAYHLLDRGGATYFDTRILGESVGDKASQLRDSGVDGKGLEDAKGLQKTFNGKSKAGEKAGKK